MIRSMARWGIGTTFILAVCGIDAWFLVDTIERTAPSAPEQVRAIEREMPSVLPQPHVIRSILRYEGDNGAPPTTQGLLKV